MMKVGQISELHTSRPTCVYLKKKNCFDLAILNVRKINLMKTNA